MFEKLIEASGGLKIVEKNRSCAVKGHFGEDGNINFVSPLYMERLTRMISRVGGRSFLTDTTTLYSGRRFRADTHIELAREHGFDFAPVMIGDGLYGDEYFEVNGAKIGRLYQDVDTIFCVSHFKGHMVCGFGGAIKNLGMGCASKGGKLEMHSHSKPHVVKERCTFCLRCFDYCAFRAIMKKGKAVAIDEGLCTGCGGCMSICPEGAIKFSWDAGPSHTQQNIARYASEVIKDKKVFCINFLINISPNCDCFHTNEPMIAPDIGILAAADPVGIDQACYDMVRDPIEKLYPKLDPTEQICAAERYGAGDRNYELENV